VREEIRALAGRRAPTQQEPASPEARFIEDLCYDSLHLMSLINEVFDELELELPDVDDIEQFEGMETVAHLEDVIIRRLLATGRLRLAQHVG